MKFTLSALNQYLKLISSKTWKLTAASRRLIHKQINSGDNTKTLKVGLLLVTEITDRTIRVFAVQLKNNAPTSPVSVYFVPFGGSHKEQPTMEQPVNKLAVLPSHLRTPRPVPERIPTARKNLMRRKLVIYTNNWNLHVNYEIYESVKLYFCPDPKTEAFTCRRM